MSLALSADFAKAVIPAKPGKVLGVQLKPYCLGHEIILQRYDSPFSGPASNPEENVSVPGIGDLLFALGVCSRDYVSALEWVRSPKLSRRMARDARRARHISEAAIKTQILLFHVHVLDSWKHPKFRTAGGSGEEMGTPLVASIFLSLCRSYGRSELEAFNTPLRQALWEHLASLENEGRISIQQPLTPERLAQVKEKASEAAELLRKLKEGNK